MVSIPVLDCHGLRRRFGELVAVDGVGFQIAAGETYGPPRLRRSLPRQGRARLRR
jgi:hypothetical protein